jgi:hypothetical protein
MKQPAIPITPAYIKALRDLGQEDLAQHLEHAYLLLRSYQDALGEIITSAAETLQREGVVSWGDGGELGDALLNIKDIVGDNYSNTEDLEAEFAGTYEEVFARRKQERRDLVAIFLDYLLAAWSGEAEPFTVPAKETAEQLVADFFTRIESGKPQ